MHNGRSYAVPGSFVDTFAAAGGCDSFKTTTMLYTPASKIFIDRACSYQPYVIHGRTVYPPAVFRDTTYGSGGSCDSFFTISIEASNYRYLSVSTCGSTYLFHGHIHAVPGQYQDTLATGTGCDSIVVLTLSLHSPLQIAQRALRLCHVGDTIYDRGHSYTQPGNYFDTLQGSFGCDSITRTTVFAMPYSDLNYTGCINVPFVFHGHSYHVPGFYIDTLQTAAGCDSSVHLYLTAQHAARPLNVYGTVCNRMDSFTYLGVNYGLGASVTIPYGCDTILSISVRLQPIHINLYQTQCAATFLYHGRSYAVPGYYQDTISHAGSCDTVTTLYLTRSAAVAGAASASLCRGSYYTFGGQRLTMGGIYYDTLTAVSGCDSIVTLVLQEYLPTATTLTVGICPDGYYDFAGSSLTTAGTYHQTLTDRHGCDSVVTLQLGVYTAPYPGITHSGHTLSSQPADHYQWWLDGHVLVGDTNRILIITQPGLYSVEVVDNHGCTGMSDTLRMSFAPASAILLPAKA